MIKIVLLSALLIMMSPFIVMLDQDHYQVSGWLGIGNYTFDVYDGLKRSFLFFLVTIPVIVALYFGRPKLSNTLNFSLKSMPLFKPVFVFMVLFSLVAFSFNLGITGVENDSGGWRLSGITHYLRSYVFLLVLGYFIFSMDKVPFLYILIYSLVAGVTGGSRFAGIAPLVLLLLRKVLIERKKVFSINTFKIMLAIFVVFSVITGSRVILLSDGYSFERILNIYSSVDLDLVKVMTVGLNELFLRVGLGRDVILGYEVAAAQSCQEYAGLFFSYGSCVKPALDFYGLHLDSERFGLRPTALSSLYVISDTFYIQFVVSCVYALTVLMFIKVSSLVNYIPGGKTVYPILYFMILIAVLIGPITIAWIQAFVVISMFFLYIFIRAVSKAKA